MYLAMKASRWKISFEPIATREAVESRFEAGIALHGVLRAGDPAQVLGVDVAADPDEGDSLDIRTSLFWKRYKTNTTVLQQGLMSQWPEPAENIFQEGLDNPEGHPAPQPPRASNAALAAKLDEMGHVR